MTYKEALEKIDKKVYTVFYDGKRPDYSTESVVGIYPTHIVSRNFYNNGKAFCAEFEDNTVELFPIAHCYSRKKDLLEVIKAQER